MEKINFDKKYNLRFKIICLKQQLQKYKEDVEQVELFRMERSDYETKIEYCKNIILELRSLENQLKQLENNENSNS